MAKAKFERTKPHVNIGTIGHVDHGKTTLTAAITKVLHDKYPRLERAARVRPDRQRRLRSVSAASRSTSRTSSTRPTKRHYAHVDCPGPRRLHQEHDHRCRPDGRRDPAWSPPTDGPMPQTREHVLLARQVGVPYIAGRPEQGRHGRRRGAPRARRAGGPRAAGQPRSSTGDDPRSSACSALKALEGDAKWVEQPIDELMDAVDECDP